MNTPFKFSDLTLQQLKELSKSRGKPWHHEQAYRDECIDIIQRTCEALNIKQWTRCRAVILMHRYFTVTSSSKCRGLDKWAHAIACLFIANKVDSGYDRLENVVHSSIVELRKQQGRGMEPEYFSPDGTPGNPAYLASLADKVRQAEQDVLLATNFACAISVPPFLVGHYLKKLGLTEEAEMEFPDLATKINAVCCEAVHIAHQSCGKGQVVVLLHPAEHIALAAIYKACRANQLQWYLGPPPQDKDPLTRKLGEVPLPDLPVERLAEVARDLPVIKNSGAGARADPQQNDGHGCFRSRGGRWRGQTASRPVLVKYEGGIRMSSAATGSSNGEAATGVRLGEPSPSPDSINGPPSSAPGSSGGGGSAAQQRRRVSFQELPPSVALLQAQFREQRSREQQYRRERSPEPHASLDSDQEDIAQGQQQVQMQQQQQGGGTGGSVLLGLKRARPQPVGLAAGEDDEDSAESKATEEGEEQDCAGTKRAKVVDAGVQGQQQQQQGGVQVVC